MFTYFWPGSQTHCLEDAGFVLSILLPPAPISQVQELQACATIRGIYLFIYFNEKEQTTTEKIRK